MALRYRQRCGPGWGGGKGIQGQVCHTHAFNQTLRWHGEARARLKCHWITGVQGDAVLYMGMQQGHGADVLGAAAMQAEMWIKELQDAGRYQRDVW